jgi:hypothetical protein
MSGPTFTLTTLWTCISLRRKKVPAGSFYFVENGEASFAQIAQAFARRLGLGKPQSWSVEEATEEWEYIHAAY